MKRYQKDLRTLKPDSQEYWDEILRREGLSMSRGRHPKTTYVGSSYDVVGIEQQQTAANTGRVAPKPNAE